MTGSMAMTLSKQWVDDLEKGKTAEVRVARADTAYPVLAHKDGGVGVMKEISGKVRIFGDDRFGDLGVALGGNQHLKTGRGKQGGDEVPGGSGGPRPPHDARMRGHAQEFVQNRPGRIPGVWTPALAFQPVAASRVKGRIGVGRVDEHIGVDRQH